MTTESIEIRSRRGGIGEVFPGPAFDQQRHKISYAGVLEPDLDGVHEASETVSRYFGIDLDEALQYLPDLSVFFVDGNHAVHSAPS
jgi:hypothetical protein